MESRGSACRTVSTPSPSPSPFPPMDQSPILQLLLEISGTDEVRKNPRLALFETQVLDSMRVVELIVALEERFGILISPAEFDREAWATPASLVRDVEARLAALA
jgi:D-alanine--poly(phosphoribitol) ligase subunit 2